MADDEEGVPLSRRVPGAARPGPGQSNKPVLSDSTLNRMQAAIDAERAQGEPEHLNTVPRYQDDPNTEPLPAVTSAGSPSSRRGKRGRTPSGAGPDAGMAPEPARKLEAVAEVPPAEVPPAEEPLRVARALRAAEPLPVRGAELPVRGAEPLPVRAAESLPVRAAEPPPARAAEPLPVRAAEPPVRAVEPVPPVRAVEPPRMRAVAPVPSASSQLPPLAGPPPGSAQPARAADGGPWWTGTTASEPGPASGPTPGTIGWLWPEETATQHGRGGGGSGPRWRPPRRWGYRAITLVTLAAGVLVGAGLFVGIALHSTPTPGGAHGNSTPKATAAPTTDPSTAPSPAAGAGALAASLTAAAAWINQQVATGTLVACDNQTCAALSAAGIPAAQQVPVQGNPQALATANVLVVDPAVRSYLSGNPGLANDVTPTVLAAFGQVTIQVVYPEGPAAYQTALNADVQARIQLGQELLNNELVTASPAAASALEAGDVDPRVLLALQAVADEVPIDILEFADAAPGAADAGPGATAGAPYRAVALAESDSASGLSQSAYLKELGVVAKSYAFPVPYLKAGPVTLPNGQAAVEVEYPAPTALGQLGSG